MNRVRANGRNHAKNGTVQKADWLAGGAGDHVLVRSLDAYDIGNDGDVGNDYIDGGAGADDMFGGTGDDIYVVNSVNDAICENQNSGYDIVVTSTNYRNFSPTAITMLHLFVGTLSSLAYVTGVAAHGVQTAGSNANEHLQLLTSYGLRADLLAGYNETGIANLIRSWRGVIVVVAAGVIWKSTQYESGHVPPTVTLTGVVYAEDGGALLGFYVTDSGRAKVSDMTRFIPIDLFREAANVPGVWQGKTNDAGWKVAA